MRQARNKHIFHSILLFLLSLQFLLPATTLAASGSYAPGDGLHARYFIGSSSYGESPDFTGQSPVIDRTDPQIDFDWGMTGVPGPCDTASRCMTRATGWGIQWDGYIRTPDRPNNDAEEIYNFEITSDDGLVVVIDNTTIFSEWKPQSTTSYNNPIGLHGNTIYPIHVDYFENSSPPANVRIAWKVPGSSSYVTIPQDNLYTAIPRMTPPPTPVPYWNTVFPEITGCVNNQGVATVNCVPVVVKIIINAALIFLGTIAVILIIYTGLRLILSRGDSKGVGQARSILVYAFIGLMIVLLAFFIINFISTITGVSCINQLGFNQCTPPS